MPDFKVYYREKFEGCRFITGVANAEEAKEALRNGHGEDMWRDPLGFVDEDHWDVEAVPDDEDDEDDEPDIDDDEPRVVPARHVPRLPDLGQVRQQFARERRVRGEVRPAEPVAQEVEEVDFNG